MKFEESLAAQTNAEWLQQSFQKELDFRSLSEVHSHEAEIQLTILSTLAKLCTASSWLVSALWILKGLLISTKHRYSTSLLCLLYLHLAFSNSQFNKQKTGYCIKTQRSSEFGANKLHLELQVLKIMLQYLCVK